MKQIGRKKQTALAIAIEKDWWELVALYLLLAFVEVAQRFPGDTLPEMLELLGSSAEGSPEATGKER